MAFLDMDLGFDDGHATESVRRASPPVLPSQHITLDAREAMAVSTGIATSLLRPIDPQPCRVPVKGRRRFCWAAKMPDGSYQDVEGDALGRFRDTCPFGKAGDAIFIREAWTSIAYGRNYGIEIHYRADDNNLTIWEHRERGRYLMADATDREDRWRPLRFESWLDASTMPAWASRITTSIKYIEVVDLLNLTPYTLAACGPLPLRPIERWCWRIDLGAVVVLEPTASATRRPITTIGAS